MATELDPCFRLNGETDSGKAAIGAIWDVAAAAFAAYNAYVAVQMAKKQDAIARRYLNIAKAHRDWYNNGFKPLEDQELAEAWALPETTPNWDTAIGRAKATGRYIFKNRLEARMRGTRPCDTGVRVGVLKDEINIQSVALAAMAGLGMRNERARVDAMNDRRWKRREQVLNRGRDMMADNIMYGTLAVGIYGDMAAQAGKGAAGAMYFLGYSSERKQTAYPGDMVFGRRQTRKAPQQQFTGTMTGGGPATPPPMEGNYNQAAFTGGGPATPPPAEGHFFNATMTGGKGGKAIQINAAVPTVASLVDSWRSALTVTPSPDEDYFIADPLAGK